jgi:hypothetical protein
MIYTAIVIDKKKEYQYRIINSGFDYKDAVCCVTLRHPDDQLVALIKGDHRSTTYCMPYKDDVMCKKAGTVLTSR